MDIWQRGILLQAYFEFQQKNNNCKRLFDLTIFIFKALFEIKVFVVARRGLSSQL